MSSALFQASQIIPTKTQIRSRRISSSHSCSSMCPIRSRSLSVSTCGALPVREVSVDSVVDQNSLDVFLNGFRRASSSCDSDSGFALSWTALALSSSSFLYDPQVKGDLRFGSIVTVKKPELVLSPKIQFDLSQKNQTKSPLETEAGGGSGDDGGDKGTSGGDGGGGDDDDYFFRNFDEGDDNGDDKHSGLFRRRFLVSEVFDKKSLDSVLREWKVTLNSLPLGIRLAYRMGLVSSAQLLRFLVINVRPTISRLISRAIPQSLSRAFMGRMIADPAFHYKLLFEQVASICCSVWWELEIRGKKRIKNEWDLALIKVFTISACNAFVVWSLAPCYSYENTSKSELQNLLQKLPNNIFEKGYRLRGFNMQNRILSFFYKAVEFFMVGLMAGAAQDALSTLAVKMKKKEGRFSALTMPRMSTSILGHGVFMGLNMNLRYQLLSGLDRALVSYFDVIGVALFFGTASRILNVQVGVKSLAYLEERGEDLVVRSWKKLSSKLGSSEDGALLPLMWVFERNVNESRHLVR